MREIVFDTETTGLDPFQGDRVVEIGCVELINHVPTGNVYHQYINPERSLSEEVVKVHGLTEEFLSDKPTFKEIADEFLSFIGSDSKLIAHNAPFDIKFLNAELSWIGKEPLSGDRVIDTVVLARKMFPGSRVNLNELCKKFHIDNSARTFHGALLDSELLAEVYLELIGGRQPDLVLEKESDIFLSSGGLIDLKTIKREFKAPRSFLASKEEVEQHTEFVKKIKNNLWGINEGD